MNTIRSLIKDTLADTCCSGARSSGKLHQRNNYHGQTRHAPTLKSKMEWCGPPSTSKCRLTLIGPSRHGVFPLTCQLGLVQCKRRHKVFSEDLHTIEHRNAYACLCPSGQGRHGTLDRMGSLQRCDFGSFQERLLVILVI